MSGWAWWFVLRSSWWWRVATSTRVKKQGRARPPLKLSYTLPRLRYRITHLKWGCCRTQKSEKSWTYLLWEKGCIRTACERSWLVAVLLAGDHLPSLFYYTPALLGCTQCVTTPSNLQMQVTSDSVSKQSDDLLNHRKVISTWWVAVLPGYHHLPSLTVQNCIEADREHWSSTKCSWSPACVPPVLIKREWRVMIWLISVSNTKAKLTCWGPLRDKCIACLNP